jgi:hypothetical protein
MSKLLFASLLFTACAASSHPTDARATVVPARPQPPTSCVANDQLLTISVISDLKGFPTSDLIISSSGAWRSDRHDGKGATTTKTGCLSSAQITALRTALRTATWQVTYAELRCMAEPIDSTQYRVNGKVVYAHRLCDGQIPDKATADALKTIHEIVGTIR